MAQNSKKQRGPGRPFKPGQSGNPGGRPAARREFRERCREIMEAEGGGWDILETMLRGSAQDRRFAVELLAAYGYGKPKQGLEVSGDPENPVGVVVLPDVHR